MTLQKCNWWGMVFLYVIIILFVISFIIAICSIKCGENFKNSNQRDREVIIWGWAINKDRKKMEKISKAYLESGKHMKLNCDLIGVGVYGIKYWVMI